MNIWTSNRRLLAGANRGKISSKRKGICELHPQRHSIELWSKVKAKATLERKTDGIGLTYYLFFINDNDRHHEQVRVIHQMTCCREAHIIKHMQ